MKYLIKRPLLDTYLKVDDLPDFITGIFDFYNSAEGLSQIKEAKFNSKNEFDSLESLDVTYFLTREKLLGIIKNANPELKIDISNCTELERAYFKSLFNDLTNDEKISIHLTENFNEVSQGYINYILYKIISLEKKIKDINTVYHFIDNHYESRFSDLILKYPLSNHYKKIILKDINPVILYEYEEKMKEIPSVEVILKMDSEEIENYYKMVWKNENIENPNNFNLQLIRSPKATEWMITNFLIKNDISFIYKEILIHKNCPLSILESLIGVEDYLEFILKNPKIDNSFLEKIRETNYYYKDLFKVYKMISNHSQCSTELYNKIIKDLDIINSGNYSNDCTPNVKNTLNKEEKENSAYDDFHINLIKDYVINHNIREILEFSNYANSYFKDTCIHELIEVKIQNSSVDDMTTIISTLDLHNDEELNNALKLTVIERLENIVEDNKELEKINNVLSGTKFFTKKEKENIENALVRKLA